MLKREFYYCCFIILLFLTFSCTGPALYKAGNRVTLDYVIDTRLNFSILRTYMDTMIMKEGYGVPSKWEQLNKLVDIDSANTKRIYFKKDPEEMYLIQFNGVLLLADVYNENIVNGDWVATEERMPKAESVRVVRRFNQEILNKIEKMAKKNNIPDSILYPY